MRIISIETAKEIDKLHLSVLLDQTNNSDNFYYSDKGYLNWVELYDDYYRNDKIYDSVTEAYLIPACRLDELFEFLLNRNIFVSVRMANSSFYYWRIYINKKELMTSGDSLNENYHNCFEEGLREALKYV